MSKRPRNRCSYLLFVLTFIFFFLPVSCGKQLPLEPVNNSSDNPFAGLNVVGIKNAGDLSLQTGIKVREFITANAGGVVAVPGIVKLDFDSGAVDEDMWIYIRIQDVEVFDWEFFPHGVWFNKPVELTISLDKADLPKGTDPSTLKIYYLSTSGDPEPLETKYDAENNTLITELHHFSRYALVTG